MDLVTHRHLLDTRRPGLGHRITVKRGETAREIVVSLAEGGKPYWIDEGCTAVFYARKSDGVPLFNACTIEQNTILYAFTGQTTNVVGIVECEIELYSGDVKLLVSPRFEILVEDRIAQDGDIPDSSPEYTALTEMVAKGTALMNDLESIKKDLEPIRDALNFTAADAGKLLMVAGDGSLVPVVVGPGLEIVGGVLRLSGDVVIPDDGETPSESSESTAELGVARLGLIILGKE